MGNLRQLGSSTKNCRPPTGLELGIPSSPRPHAGHLATAKIDTVFFRIIDLVALSSNWKDYGWGSETPKVEFPGPHFQYPEISVSGKGLGWLNPGTGEITVCSWLGCCQTDNRERMFQLANSSHSMNFLLHNEWILRIFRQMTMIYRKCLVWRGNYREVPAGVHIKSVRINSCLGDWFLGIILERFYIALATLTSLDG